jgi:hypothetical protein
MSTHDVLVAPAWMAVNLLLVQSMWRTAGRIFTDHAFFAKMGHTIVLCWACVAGVAILLGLFGALSAYALLGGVALIAVFALWPSKPGDDGSSARSQAKEKVPADTNPVRAPTGMFAGYSQVEGWCWLGWCLWAALCAGRVVVSGLLEFPSNWDTLAYHLPLVDQWLSTGSLYVPAVSKWFYPGNSELVALWMVAPFSGDFLAPLNNFPAVILFVLSAVQLTRMLGVAPLPCHLGVLALVSNYVVSHQLLDNKNDVAAVSLFFSYLLYSFRYLKSTRLADLVFASICLGLFTGVKYYALLYAGMGLGVIVILTAISRGPRAATLALSVCLIGVVLWSGYWYGRNLLVTGSPIYPKTLSAAADVQTGANPDLWHTTLLGNTSPEKWFLWWRAVWRMTGPCQVVALILLPASLLSLFIRGLMVRRKGPHGDGGNLHWALLAITTFSGLLYAITPNTIEVRPHTLGMVKVGYVTVRLGLCFFSLTLLCAIILVNNLLVFASRWVADRGTERWDGETSSAARTPAASGWRFLSIVFLAAAAGAVALQTATEHRVATFVIDRKLSDQFLPSLLLAESLVVVAALVLLAWQHFVHWRRLLSTILRISLLTGAAVVAGHLGERWHSGFTAYYNQFFRTSVFTCLQEMDPASTRICVPGSRAFPFAGSGRQFPVYQANTPPVRVRRFKSRRAILQYVRAHDVTVIALHREALVRTVGGVYDWGEQDTNIFPTIWTDGSFILKRVQSDLLLKTLSSSQDED